MNTVKTLIVALLLTACASADVVLYTTVKTPLRYESSGESGALNPYKGSSPVRTAIKNAKGDKTAFKITKADGTVVFTGSGAYSQTYLISDTPDGPKCSEVSWNLFNGQTLGKTFRLYNATTKPLSFAVEDGAGKGAQQTIAPGQSKDLSGANPLRNDLFTLHFEGGQELKSTVRLGRLTVLYANDRDPDKVQGYELGHIHPPSGI